jgi:hypothetical protein
VEIKATNSENVFIIDDHLYEHVMVRKHGKDDKPRYRKWRIGTHGYPSGLVKGKLVTLHAHIIGQASRGMFIDHINGNKLDNRVANLRICTHSQNQCNRPKPSVSPWKYKGIYKNGNNFGSRICLNQKTIKLGTYKTQEEAARAYDKAAIKLHGEFAFLNFPEERSA